MNQAQVIKIHSDFYYVKFHDKIYECKIREILKKTGKDIFVGDNVLIEITDEETQHAVIYDIVKRQNLIPRPAVANLDQLVVISSIKDPEFDYIQLNRYLSFAKLYGISAIICINKIDLTKDTKKLDEIKKVYNSLNYEVITISAKTKDHIDELKQVLQGKFSVFCGQSGVGKSSILNSLSNSLDLRVKQVSQKNLRGTHTTRHSEILELNLNGESARIADTPGFSLLKFDNILPNEINNLFDDILKLSKSCKYNNCLHLEEDTCNVLKNLKKLQPYRYESYKTFVTEALKYKERLANEGNKKEKTTKTLDNKAKSKLEIAKLGAKSREKSRKTQKQNLIYETLDEF